MFVDVLNSELFGLLVAQNAVPLKATITKPKAKAGPKRKGARATKKLEQLQSKGHVLDPEEATADRGLSPRGHDLPADRTDVSSSAKELGRELARPNRTSFI